MNITPNTSSAKIYQFTARKRVGSLFRHAGSQVVELPRAPGHEIVHCSGAWYHEAAIAEEARGRKS